MNSHLQKNRISHKKVTLKILNGIDQLQLRHECLTNPTIAVHLSELQILEHDVDIVIDTSALIAVIVGAPERAKIIAITAGNTLDIKMYAYEAYLLAIYGRKMYVNENNQLHDIQSLQL